MDDTELAWMRGSIAALMVMMDRLLTPFMLDQEAADGLANAVRADIENLPLTGKLADATRAEAFRMAQATIERARSRRASDPR